MKVELFLVGPTAADAVENEPCISLDDAEGEVENNPGWKVWSVQASINFDSMEEVQL